MKIYFGDKMYGLAKVREVPELRMYVRACSFPVLVISGMKGRDFPLLAERQRF